jgi:predicted NBD/HSP70 family sugar kinase/predicted transcriptional regulator
MGPTRLPRSQNNKIVRKKNIQAMLRLIRKYEPVTTETLMTKSGLSYPTVFGIIKELLDDGVIEKQGYARSTGGRQPILYSICANYHYTMGIHIYTKWIGITISNISGGKVFESTEAKNTLDMKMEQVLAELKIRVQKASSDTSVPFDKLAGICISLPEALHDRLFGKASEQILGEMMECLTGADTTVVFDSAMLNFLELKKFAHSELVSYIHVSFSLSIGVTAYRNNEGRDSIIGTRGMFEHTIVVPGGVLCHCGKRGCLETYYNGPALYAQYAAECAARGIALPEYEKLAQKGLFRALLSRCMHSDDAAVTVIRGAISMLGVSLANLVMTLGIFHIMISGLFNSNDITFFNYLSDCVRSNLPDTEKDEVELLLGMALPEDCAYGGCLMLNQRYFEHFHKDAEPSALPQQPQPGGTL